MRVFVVVVVVVEFCAWHRHQQGRRRRRQICKTGQLRHTSRSCISCISVHCYPWSMIPSLSMMVPLVP
jgi:hypothetical protein